MTNARELNIEGASLTTICRAQDLGATEFPSYHSTVHAGKARGFDAALLPFRGKSARYAAR
jgi:hypothetical protein